jgi:aldose 1-epimerase
MGVQGFGRLPDGAAVDEVVISAGDLTATVITYGAAIRDLRLAGFDHPLVLGLETLEDYVRHSPHLGAIAGRCANRIGRGRFAIDGRPVQLPLNEKGRHHIHGGEAGFGRRPWRLVDVTEAGVTLSLVSADREEGYPGRVEATVRYVVSAPATITMEATAVTDAQTIVNLAQHSYFNLDDSDDILDHRVQILADAYTPTDPDDIPTGEIVAVAGTHFDFRAPRPIRKVHNGGRVLVDKNFVVARRKSARPVAHAWIASARNGLRLDVSSTEPGLQFYDGSYLAVPARGLGGRRYRANRGCCFEPQIFPDAVNHPGFPSPILRPGETYRQVTRFAFSQERPASV